jgi:hypothetical protein
MGGIEFSLMMTLSHLSCFKIRQRQIGEQSFGQGGVEASRDTGSFPGLIVKGHLDACNYQRRLSRCTASVIVVVVRVELFERLNNKLISFSFNLGNRQILGASVPQSLHFPPELGFLDREAAKFGNDRPRFQTDVIDEHSPEQVQS